MGIVLVSRRYFFGPSPRSSSTVVHSVARDSGGSGDGVGVVVGEGLRRVVVDLGQLHRQHRLRDGDGQVVSRRRRSGTARPSSAAG